MVEGEKAKFLALAVVILTSATYHRFIDSVSFQGRKMSRPKSYKEFSEMMWKYDQERASLQEPIPYRPFSANEYFRREFEWSGSMQPKENYDLYDNDFSDDAILGKAYEWYYAVYGEHARSKDAISNMWAILFIPIILGNGVAWKIRIPKSVGKIGFFVDKTNIDDDCGRPCDICGMSKYNILSLISPSPKGLLPYIDEEQVRQLYEIVTRFYNSALWMHELRKRVLIGHALQDYKSSTANILMDNFSCAKWDASQAAEKLMKWFLEGYNIGFKWDHNFINIKKSIELNVGLMIPERLIEASCYPPKHRYGEANLTLPDCIEANHAVLEIARLLSDKYYEDKKRNADE